MSFALYWQRAAFLKNITLLMNHIAGQCLNYLEFQLLTQQGNIVFCSKEDEDRCKRLFDNQSQILKTQILHLLMLVQIKITHARQQYIVKFKRSKDQLVHSANNCFLFWKSRMAQKYGAVHGWFEALCQQRDIRRVSLPRFLTHLQRILQNSIHKNCAKRISFSFQKSKKNEIQFSVFMNVILIESKSQLSKSLKKRQRTYSAATSKRTKKDERYHDIFSQSKDWLRDTSTIIESTPSKIGFQSLRELAPKKPMYNKYMTPKFKIKKCYSNFLNQ